MENVSFDFFPYSMESDSVRADENPEPVPPPKE